MTGALVGQATESGFFRGAGIGAISGAVFSIEVFESSLVLWRSDESRIWSLIYVVSNMASKLLVRVDANVTQAKTSLSALENECLFFFFSTMHFADTGTGNLISCWVLLSNVLFPPRSITKSQPGALENCIILLFQID